MHLIDFNFPFHDKDASPILRQSLEEFQRAHRDAQINAAEVSWDKIWSSLVRVALYKDSAKVR